MFEAVNRGVYRISSHLIDVLLRAVEKLPDITVDLAYFTGAAIDELIGRLGPDIHHGYHGDQAHRDEGHQHKGQDELVFDFPIRGSEMQKS